MNIFYLDKNPKLCAQYHGDRHVVKMILESSQLLSTTYRILDGTEYIDSSSGRKIKRWKLDQSENLLYKATHINHPSNIWVRKSSSNYIWLSKLLEELCKEYTYRYGKIHKCEEIGLVKFFKENFPKNLKNGIFSDPSLAMPEKYRVKDHLTSYHNYYNGDKRHLHSWKKREIPPFIRGES